MKKLNWLQKLREYIFWWFGKFQYRSKVLPDNPISENIQSDIVYIVGGEDYVKWAYFKCPDGCGDTIMLSLSPNKRPSWKIKQDGRGRVSLYPSINKQDGCKSHFWLKKGKIKWAEKYA